ncbi:MULTISPECIES: VWA domain-containing protein [unclassified Crossiella]|uniref:VWA domain-containing protein n=1 Tax=unclassified Crossiella TaxID=2620835 RepID=UPI001FFED7C2|nr:MULTISPECIES: VWA domain-containing protein [unclassified Crossiella]MCK2240640.1 VWA domain-containing protein [Crossiella sp. S99.2]MCK2252909.1 VWA domain-containing protein [Crossiella sp. S99.1]
MSEAEYEGVLRRVFGMIVPGHRVFVTPAGQPCTRVNPLGFTVGFPVSQVLAAGHFHPVWQELAGTLPYQMISYLAGHEAMHAWEHTQGYRPQPATTLRGVIANILADIRGDHLPMLDRLSHWPLNREMAYLCLLEPYGEPADAAAGPSAVQDAQRLLAWGMLIMRCGRLRRADGSETDHPADPVFATVWPEIASTLVRARHTSWQHAAPLGEELINVLWEWVRQREHEGEEGERTSREEFERQLLDHLHATSHPAHCIGRNSPEGRPQPRGDLLRFLREAVDHQRYRRAVVRIYHEERGPRNYAELVLPPEEWAQQADPGAMEVIRRWADLVPVLTQQFAAVLRPLLTAPARRRCPSSSGPRLDLERQAGRVYLNAHHHIEHAPRIWLNDNLNARRLHRLQCVLLLDCSASMLDPETGPKPAPAAHAAATALVNSVSELDGLAAIGIAGFADKVMVIRDLTEGASVANAQEWLAQAQASGEQTQLAPALAWAAAQFARVDADRRTRRLLLIITDACLDDGDLADSAALVTTIDEDVLVVAIGVAETSHPQLRRVVPVVVTVSPDRVDQLPPLVQQVLEDAIGRDRVLG